MELITNQTSVNKELVVEKVVDVAKGHPDKQVIARLVIEMDVEFTTDEEFRQKIYALKGAKILNGDVKIFEK